MYCSHNSLVSTCSCNYTKTKVYDVHIWQVAGYLTDSNVPHNIVLQMKQLNIHFGLKVSIEQVFTTSSLP